LSLKIEAHGRDIWLASLFNEIRMRLPSFENSPERRERASGRQKP
jgi:hypothetical protein